MSDEGIKNVADLKRLLDYVPDKSRVLLWDGEQYQKVVLIQRREYGFVLFANLETCAKNKDRVRETFTAKLSKGDRK